MKHYQKFQIQQLRAKNLAKILETIAAYLAALFITALLPSLLVRYLYSSDQLMTEQPVLLEYIPVITFVVAVGYMIYAIIGNFKRERLAKRLEAELEAMAMDGDGCCGGGHHHDHGGSADISAEEMRELESIVDNALKTKPKKSAVSSRNRTSKSSSARKSAK